MGDLWCKENRERARRENAERKGGKRECRVCGEWKMLEQFPREPNSTNGRRWDCKPCWVLRQQFARREARA
jgi:hypothetical protein